MPPHDSVLRRYQRAGILTYVTDWEGALSVRVSPEGRLFVSGRSSRVHTRSTALTLSRMHERSERGLLGASKCVGLPSEPGPRRGFDLSSSRPKPQAACLPASPRP